MTALPPLDEICPACNGTKRTGVINEPNRWSSGVSCERCEGLGRSPTEAGKQVLAFLSGRRLNVRL